MFKKLRLFSILLAAVLTLTVATAAQATEAADINKDSQQALANLYKTHPVAQTLAKSAKAILIFPSIVKGGFIIGGSYGEGALIKNGATVGYYNSVSGSWGLQAGAQTYGYAVFLMTDKAEQYIHKTQGWEIGVGFPPRR